MAGPGVVDGNLTYLQIDILDQHPVEPYFNGDIFISLGGASGRTPVHVTATMSGTGTYRPSTVSTDINYDENAKTLWMSKPIDLGLNRLSGAHWNFPFDSAKFEFDITYDSPIPINNFILRNRNLSFDLVCDANCFKRRSPNAMHIAFALNRNPLVTLTAVVLMIAGVLFLVAIVAFVKADSMATSVASFFFSLWSIRTILSSEIKTFPTILDLAILSLCVVLLVALGIRLAIKEIRALERVDEPRADGHDEGF
jgi:uncharacterized membrane protein